MPWQASSDRDLTVERLRELLDYNKNTGMFTRRVSTSPRAMQGMIAGDVDAKGYWRLRVNGKRYLAHRLAFFYVNGVWPVHEVDHINCVRTDNRWENLREATPQQNKHNTKCHADSKTGIKGVDISSSGKWRARIRIDGKEKHLGNFHSVAEAVSAYRQAAIVNRGKYARAA